MLVEQIVSEARKLSRSQQYEVVQQMISALAADDQLLYGITPNSEYEVWSPYDSGEAANQMLKALEEHQSQQAAADSP
jgi:hypothetical protein